MAKQASFSPLSNTNTRDNKDIKAGAGTQKSFGSSLQRPSIQDTFKANKVSSSQYAGVKKGKSKLVALACSTGGPKSLQSVIPMLPKNLE